MKNAKKKFERDQVFQNTEESKKDQKMETRLMRKISKKKNRNKDPSRKNKNYVFVRM